MNSADLRAFEAQLAELATLKPGWNSYNAPAIDPTALEKAEEIVVAVWQKDLSVPAPQVGPMPDGRVHLMWQAPGWELEMEVGGDEVFYTIAPSPPLSWTKVDELVEEVVEFHRRRGA